MIHELQQWLRVGGNRSVFWLGVGVLLGAIGLRWGWLGSYPYGIFGDETFSAMEAIATWDNLDFKVFYNTNGGREGGHIWIFALIHGLFEPSRWTLRAGVALVGTLSVLWTPFAVYEWLRPNPNTEEGTSEKQTDETVPEGMTAETRTVIALAAMVLIAFSYWHVNFSRYAIRGILDVMYGALSIFCLSRAFRPQAGWGVCLLTGLVVGLGLYGYGTYKFLAVPMAYWMVHRRADPKRVAVVAVVTLLIISPLITYIVTQGDAYFARLNKLSVQGTGHPVVAFVVNVLEHLKMLFLEGDSNGRHNLWPQPQLSPILSVLMLLGVWQAGRAVWRGQSALLTRPQGIFLFIWLAVMFIPASVTNQRIPHAHRTIGLILPCVTLGAIGWGTLWHWLRHQPTERRVLGALGSGLLFVSVAWNYFVTYGNVLFDEYPHEAVKAAEHMRSLPAQVPRVIVTGNNGKSHDHNVYTFEYLLNDRDQTYVKSLLLPVSELPARLKAQPNTHVYSSVKYEKQVRKLKLPAGQMHLYEAGLRPKPEQHLFP